VDTNRDPQRVESETRAWIEQVVVGFDLCPFAQPSLARGGLRIVISDARDPEALAEALIDELVSLQRPQAETIESSLLVHPEALGDFARYNAFLPVCQRVLVDLALVGTFQLASFHPDYRFAATPDDDAADDAADYSNRSPWPMLHILRETAVERAIQTHSDPRQIPRRNAARLRRLGSERMRIALAGCSAPGEDQRRSGA